MVKLKISLIKNSLILKQVWANLNQSYKVEFFYNSDGQNLYGAKNILYIELWSYMNCEAIKNRLLIDGYLFYCLQFQNILNIFIDSFIEIFDIIYDRVLF